jgi:hypothetical protein
LRGLVTGYNHRGFKMSFGHDLIEVLGLSSGESSKAEVITDKEIRPEKSFNPFFPGIICSIT